MLTLLKSVAVSFFILFLSGCAGLTGNSGMNSTMELRLERQIIPSCKVATTFTNTSEKLTYEPFVEMIAFDANDNTLGSVKFYFDQILPSKKQTQKQHITYDDHCGAIKKITILETADLLRCSTNSCVRTKFNDFVVN